MSPSAKAQRLWDESCIRNLAFDYADSVRAIRDGLRAIANLDLLGRGGLFWYSHLHDQLRLAKDYIRSIPDGAGRSTPTTEHVATHREIGEQAVVRAPTP